MIYAGAGIASFSRTQRRVTLSSTESEYVALADCMKESLFLRQMLEALQPDANAMGIRVYEDNDRAILSARHTVNSGPTKHVDDRHHFIRDLCRKGKVRIEHENSSMQRAGVPTRPLREEISTERRNFFLKFE